MPRYRKLHVKALESLDINDMPDDFTRLFWVLLPLALDCEGRGIDSQAWLKSKVFPLRVDVTPAMLQDAWEWFTTRGMVIRYQVESRAYFYLPTFLTYQGDTGKEAESQYPVPPGLVQTYSGPTPELVESKSASDADTDADATTDADPTTTADRLAVAAAVSLLAEAGIDGIPDDERDAWKHPELAYALIQHGMADARLKNWRGWVRDQMRKGKGPPARAAPPGNGDSPADRRRYVEGKYAAFIEH